MRTSASTGRFSDRKSFKELTPRHAQLRALEHQIQQARETGSLDRAAARTALIFVNDRHCGKTQLAGQLGQLVLPALALQVVMNLVHARLAHINHGPALGLLLAE